MFHWLRSAAQKFLRKSQVPPSTPNTNGWRRMPKKWTKSVVNLLDPFRVSAVEAQVVKRDLESRLKSAERNKDALLIQSLNSELAMVQVKLKGYQQEATERERVLFALSCVGALISIVLYWDDTLSRFKIAAVFRILRSTVKEHDPANFVPRELEGNITFQFGVPQPWYDVVLGPKGCGKTSLLRHALAGTRGATMLSVSEQDKNVYPRIAEAFNIRSSHYRLDDHHQLVDLFQRASWWVAQFNRFVLLTDSKKWVPSIVVEFDHQSDFSTITAIANQLKHLAVDDECVRVILLLSDPSLQFALPKDPMRQKIKWIEDMTRAEARALFEKRGLILSDTDATLIFEKLGTRPGNLRRVMGDLQEGNVSIQGEVDKATAWAKDEMLGMLQFEESPANTQKIQFKSILHTLLSNPSGVSVSQFQGATGVPMLVGPLLKQWTPLVYHSPTRNFVFSSPLHYEAAKQLRDHIDSKPLKRLEFSTA